MTRRLPVFLLLSLAGWFVTAPPAAAHDATTTAHVAATSQDEDVQVVLELEYDLLMKSAWLYADAYRATEAADQLRQLEQHHDEVTAYVVERFQVAYDQQRCTGEAAEPASVTRRAGRSYAVLSVDYDCAGGRGATHALYSALFPDQENFVHSTRTLVEYDVDGVTGSAVLTVGDPRFDVTSEVGSDATLVPAEQRGIGRLWDFGVLGAEHMLLGLDHLLFLLALLIGARGRRDVVVTASAFTAAHSVTFGLASMGVVPVPSAFVEPVIAASIVVVALLGLRSRRQEASAPWRVPAALGFGLLHGLGFAGALGIEDPASWQLLWSLLAFNAGLEVAQLAVILLVFPLLRQLRRASVGPRLITVAGLAVAAIGAFWLLERLPLAARLMASG